MKIKKITVTYIENDRGKREVFLFDELLPQDQETFMTFFNTQKEFDPPEISIHIPLQPKKEGDKIDVICPIYWVNKYFLSNVQKWFEQVPIRKLYLGINNEKVTIETEDPRVEIIEQTRHKTLGACLSELMERTRTECFIYTHSDVEPIFGAYEIMLSGLTDETGIIESDHIHWEGLLIDNERFFSENFNYRNRLRAYSGFQLFRKKAIKPILMKIDDDYVYRNEDLIFQAECRRNNYKYKKSLASHIHQVLNRRWTFDEIETNMMQVKGLIKYTEPDDITKSSVLASLAWCKKHGKMELKEILFFCYENNPNWSEIIMEGFK